MPEAKKSVAAECAHEAGAAMVRVDALRKFSDVVKRIGGDPQGLLVRAQIDPSVLNNRHAVIPHRALVLLLERAAGELNIPDFGMRLAAAQGGLKVLGPLEFVMRNSRSLRDAFHYCARHPQVYSNAVQIRFETVDAAEASFLRFKVLLPRLPSHPQTVEHALLLAQSAALEISGGRVRAREIWFRHKPLSPLPVYHEYFGAEIRFDCSMDGLSFAAGELDLPIPDTDPQIYEISTAFIKNRFPSPDAVLSTRIRSIVERLLMDGECTCNSAAAMLGMHPRTLQRRLRQEGESFESIKDGVRRNLALHYLKQSSIPLTRIAQMLGYSETSALSRSCYRWFSASPRQLRAAGATHSALEQANQSA